MHDWMLEECRASRRRMVDEQIRGRGIDDPRVLAAMEEVPRELFVPPEKRDAAFSDGALPLGCGQTISQPYVVAYMTACLEVQAHHRVLEVGTGSGYQTAVLARLAAEVYTIERVGALLSAARALLNSLGVGNVRSREGDGSLGWPEFAPFDRIMVTAAAPRVPESLVRQLGEGGRLVIPVGGVAQQTLTLIRLENGRVIETPRLPVRFVKLVGDQAWSADTNPTEEK
ncbi:MAG: protein-L-isoaspartate(D-aspartate) O-methyltransferase [Phycisphaerae bacterium]|nr:protein-L-isoaspartate(D-aspartate) O-methyltransferase [Phycisphaerae bacterium]